MSVCFFHRFFACFILELSKKIRPLFALSKNQGRKLWYCCTDADDVICSDVDQQLLLETDNLLLIYLLFILGRTFQWKHCFFQNVPRKTQWPQNYCQIQKTPGQAPFSFTISVPGFLLRALHNTRDLQLLRPHPKGTKQLWFSVLLKGHKHRERPDRDSNPHSANTRTWVPNALGPLGPRLLPQIVCMSLQVCMS